MGIPAVIGTRRGSLVDGADVQKRRSAVVAKLIPSLDRERHYLWSFYGAFFSPINYICEIGTRHKFRSNCG